MCFLRPIGDTTKTTASLAPTRTKKPSIRPSMRRMTSSTGSFHCPAPYPPTWVMCSTRLWRSGLLMQVISKRGHGGLAMTEGHSSTQCLKPPVAPVCPSPYQLRLRRVCEPFHRSLLTGEPLFALLRHANEGENVSFQGHFGSLVSERSGPVLTQLGVRQESWQRIGGESPPRGRSSQPPRPRVMRGVPRGPT